MSSHCSSALIKQGKKSIPMSGYHQVRLLSHEFLKMIFPMFTNYHNCDFMQGKLHSPAPGQSSGAWACPTAPGYGIFIGDVLQDKGDLKTYYLRENW